MENTKKSNNNETKCDIAIIGGGPAGMSAGLYSARMGFKTLIFEGAAIGGQMAVTPHIENYPGVPGPINGMELAETMKKQAESFGATIAEKNVVKIENDSTEKTLVLSDGTQTTCKAIIIASGAKSRKLNAKGENEFFGKGVSYCAV
ncbi:MAG: FAD-dependent oxidoreductase, partial [Candidatus Diapherotrites archaeon]|nr:FAD-dependent oxidoreductase [Candidatus Diapherotrites archaeon]